MGRTTALILAALLASGCLGGQGGPAATAAPSAAEPTRAASAPPAATAPAASPAATPAPASAPPAPTQAAPSATPAPTPAPTAAPTEAPAEPSPSALQAALDAAKDLTSADAQVALRDYCDGWRRSSWSQRPSLPIPVEVYAAKFTPDPRTSLLSAEEYLAGRKVSRCDCLLFLVSIGRMAGPEARPDFLADTDCGAWASAHGCKLLCYGDSEAECKAAHGCA